MDKVDDILVQKEVFLSWHLLALQYPLEQRIRIVDTVIPFADIRDILEDEDGIS